MSLQLRQRIWRERRAQLKLPTSCCECLALMADNGCEWKGARGRGERGRGSNEHSDRLMCHTARLPMIVCGGGTDRTPRGPRPAQPGLPRLPSIRSTHQGRMRGRNPRSISQCRQPRAPLHSLRIPADSSFPRLEFMCLDHYGHDLRERRKQGESRLWQTTFLQSTLRLFI